MDSDSCRERGIAATFYIDTGVSQTKFNREHMEHVVAINFSTRSIQEL
jgi:hypothetical protein